MSKPIISIITAVYNAKEHIEVTIKSIINQSYQNIEFIIVDGGSTDGTIDIIKKYNSKISYWMSEKDNGVFNAMNKGIEKANGKWINFMNAGDYFVDENVLTNIDFHSYVDFGIIYGNTYYEKTGVEKPFISSSLQYGMIMACHQSMFFNKALLKDKLHYSSKFKLICDYDLICRIINENYPVKYIDLLIAYYMGGGLSSSKNWEARKARYYFIYKHFKFRGLIKSILESLGLLSLPNKIR